MTSPPMEPAAEIRRLANAVRQVYVALINEGFSEAQALTVVGQILIANAGKAGS